jgi:heat shock protein HslJ
MRLKLLTAFTCGFIVAALIFIWGAIWLLIAVIDGNPTTNTNPNAVSMTLLTSRQWQMQLDRDDISAIPTIEFSTDGRVTGFAGCNSFSSSYTIEGERITFGALATTKKYCAETSDFEAIFLKDLATVNRFKVSSNVLELFTLEHGAITFE